MRRLRRAWFSHPERPRLPLRLGVYAEAPPLGRCGRPDPKLLAAETEVRRCGGAGGDRSGAKSRACPPASHRRPRRRRKCSHSTHRPPQRLRPRTALDADMAARPRNMALERARCQSGSPSAPGTNTIRRRFGGRIPPECARPPFSSEMGPLRLVAKREPSPCVL